MNLAQIKHWRSKENLKPFFDIKCASAELETCTLGEVLDYLISQVEVLRETLLDNVRCDRHDADGCECDGTVEEKRRLLRENKDAHK